MRPAGKREPAGRGRAKNEEKKRACFPYSFSHSLCLSVSRSRLVIVAVCGIPCRLVSRLVPPSRSVVSFPVCLFRFRFGASRSVVSFYLVSLLRLVVLLPLICLHFIARSVHHHHCHRCRRRSCLSPCCLCWRFRSRHPSLPVLRFMLPWRFPLPSSRCPI